MITDTYYPLINLVLIFFGSFSGVTAYYFYNSLTGSTNTTNIYAQNPELYEYINKTGFFALSMDTNDYMFYLCLFVFMSECFTIVLFGIGIIVFIVTIRKRIRQNQHTQTHQLQFVLFKALIIQIVLMFVFLMLPLNSLMFCLITKSTFADFPAYFLFMAISSHATFEYISQFYLIAPYRDFLTLVGKKCTWRIKKYFNMKVSEEPKSIAVTSRLFEMKTNHAISTRRVTCSNIAQIEVPTNRSRAFSVVNVRL